MTTASLTRDSARALPFLGALGAVLSGTEGFVAAIAGGLVVWLGLVAMAWATARLLSDGEQAPALAVFVLIGKTAALLASVGWLMQQFDPASVALGGSCIVVGAIVGGVRDAMAAGPVVEAEEG